MTVRSRGQSVLVCGDVIDCVGGRLRCVDNDVARERSVEERHDAEVGLWAGAR
jgi:hypothetical protein